MLNIIFSSNYLYVTISFVYFGKTNQPVRTSAFRILMNLTTLFRKLLNSKTLFNSNQTVIPFKFESEGFGCYMHCISLTLRPVSPFPFTSRYSRIGGRLLIHLINMTNIMFIIIKPITINMVTNANFIDTVSNDLNCQ